MRGLVLLLLSTSLLLGGCHRNFDDQYADTEKKLQAQAKQLDADMAKAGKQEPGAPAKQAKPIR